MNIIDLVRGICADVGSIFYLGEFEGAVILLGIGVYIYVNYIEGKGGAKNG